ncbi:hypothetical protein MWN33_04215 [Starkeya koreensis]|uniref:Uncharacterized protein n=1 Tax=Ancylobacter koreensis TaxID=266121 RepID=A0ABT0DIX1_9HYPH|nr:hypothetical protein [Ancylobacter koreensis]MCK0207235.1 hypothetical protein [Ancylobacter koreensis]
MAGRFPLSRRTRGAIAGGAGAVAGLLTANALKGAYADVRDSAVLYALIMFLASFFFIWLLRALLDRLDAEDRHR